MTQLLVEEKVCAYPVLQSFLHDALPICAGQGQPVLRRRARPRYDQGRDEPAWQARAVGTPDGGALPAELPGRLPVRPVRHRDRKSTRLNSSHMSISYAVFCLKKKIPALT